MYAQTIQGDSWMGEKMDKAKIDKMSGTETDRASEDTQHADATQINKLASCTS